MSLCVIYGPVASGKLTTAEAFAKKTHYRLFHNHLIQDILVDLFPYEREDLSDKRTLLSREIRKKILSAVLSSDVNVVMTMNFGGKGGLDLMRFIVSEAENYSQPLFIVRLCPEREELNRRVVNESRKQYTKTVSVKRLNEILAGEGYGYEKFPDVEHLEVDNTKIPADAVADRIIAHYEINIQQRTED